MSISQKTFVLGTALLAGFVFLGCYLLATWVQVFVGQYLVGLALIGHVALVYRREQAIRWRWPWRGLSALGLAGLTYVFVASAYAPSPQPFEAVGQFQTQSMIMQHYAVFLVTLLPLLISCRATERAARQPTSHAIVTRIL